VKLFVTASVAERARRRFLELQGRGVAADLAQVEAEIRDRDAQDANRPVAPLKPAEDAVMLDTTASIAAALDAAFAAALCGRRSPSPSGSAPSPPAGGAPPPGCSPPPPSAQPARIGRTPRWTG
jgi:CMP/dCMP kinase